MFDSQKNYGQNLVGLLLDKSSSSCETAHCQWLSLLDENHQSNMGCPSCHLVVSDKRNAFISSPNYDLSIGDPGDGRTLIISYF